MTEMTSRTKESKISDIRPLPSIVCLGTILRTIRNLLLDSMGCYYLVNDMCTASRYEIMLGLREFQKP